MAKVTLKIKAETHEDLIKLLSKRQIKKGKRVTLDALLKELIENAKKDDKR